MGKYPHSPLHGLFSDWHWKKCARDACLTDIDRIWMEQRKREPVAVYDIKNETKNKTDSPTNTEKILANWFEDNGIPYYLVYIRKDFSRFIVYRPRTYERKVYPEYDMINWINSGLPSWSSVDTVLNEVEEDAKDILLARFAGAKP